METPPPITTHTAAILLVLYALIYFLPFYTSKLTRPSPTLSRDAPSVIKARIASVLVSCFFASLATFFILVKVARTETEDAIHMMGVWPPAPFDSFRALLLTALLFLGPLFSYLVIDGGLREWLRLEPLKELCTEWTTWRNIVAVRSPSRRPDQPVKEGCPANPVVQGPVTEEILYRSASIPLMLIARTPVKQTIFLSPLIFGLSHVHHFYEFRLTHPKVPVAAALLRSAFQLAYTTLFGAYATFLFVRTGSSSPCASCTPSATRWACLSSGVVFSRPRPLISQSTALPRVARTTASRSWRQQPLCPLGTGLPATCCGR